MPSQESQILADFFEGQATRLAANPNIDIATMRDMCESLHTVASEPTDVTYEEIEVGGHPAILCKPVAGALDRVILYTHGGGFALNSRHSHRKLAGHLSKAAGCLALVIEYRLAPEHPFPAQLEDAVAAYKWLLDQGFTPDHIATAGDSAGGNLATSTVLKLREDGIPLPAAVVGFSPWMDVQNTGPTMETNAATDKLVQREFVDKMALMYVGQDSQKLVDPLVNPLLADPTGLPPMYLVVGTFETLQSDSERFAEKAEKAGVEVHLERSEGQQHVYVAMAGKAPEADETIANVGRFLREKLGLLVSPI